MLPHGGSARINGCSSLGVTSRSRSFARYVQRRLVDNQWGWAEGTGYLRLFQLLRLSLLIVLLPGKHLKTRPFCARWRRLSLSARLAGLTGGHLPDKVAPWRFLLAWPSSATEAECLWRRNRTSSMATSRLWWVSDGQPTRAAPLIVPQTSSQACMSFVSKGWDFTS